MAKANRLNDVREYIQEHPNYSPTVGAKALRCAVSCFNKHAAAIRKELGLPTRRNGRRIKDASAVSCNGVPEPCGMSNPVSSYSMTVTVPDGGLELKLTDGRNVLGTLDISRSGVRYTKANGRLRPERELAYRIIQALQDAVVVV